MDPDVLVGHNFIGFTLDVLLHRMKSHKMEKSWSKIGRLRRTRFVFVLRTYPREPNIEVWLNINLPLFFGL